MLAVPPRSSYPFPSTERRKGRGRSMFRSARSGSLPFVSARTCRASRPVRAKPHRRLRASSRIAREDSPCCFSRRTVVSTRVSRCCPSTLWAWATRLPSLSLRGSRKPRASAGTLTGLSADRFAGFCRWGVKGEEENRTLFTFADSLYVLLDSMRHDERSDKSRPSLFGERLQRTQVRQATFARFAGVGRSYLSQVVRGQSRSEEHTSELQS